MQSPKRTALGEETILYSAANLAVAMERPIIYSAAEKAERRALGLPPDETSPPGILRSP